MSHDSAGGQKLRFDAHTLPAKETMKCQNAHWKKKST